MSNVKIPLSGIGVKSAYVPLSGTSADKVTNMNKKKNKPPVIAEKLFVLFTRYKKEYDYKESLRELYDINYQKKGRILSHLWYWRQILGAIPQFYYNLFYWSTIMFKNYIKIAYRSLKKNKLFSISNRLKANCCHRLKAV